MLRFVPITPVRCVMIAERFEGDVGVDVGFSIRIAPGIRVRASSRGIRTSVGPRIARVHVGAGQAGISTGLGPVGYYTSLGGSASRQRSSSGATAAATIMLSAAKVEKLERAKVIAAALEAITRLHEQDFEPAERPLAEPPDQVDGEALRKEFVRGALKGINIFRRAARRAAVESATRHAQLASDAERERRAASHRLAQAALDQAWAEIVANDPVAVMQQLVAAFEDNAAPAAPLAIDGSEATVAVLIPGDDSIPDQMPGITAAGNPSIRKMTKKERDGLIALLVAGYVLATVKETFAVAPGLTSVRIVALRSAGMSAYGTRRGEAVAAALVPRAALAGVLWTQVDAHAVLKDVSEELVLNERGSSGALAPIDLSNEPDLARIVAEIDFEDLT